MILAVYTPASGLSVVTSTEWDVVGVYEDQAAAKQAARDDERLGTFVAVDLATRKAVAWSRAVSLTDVPAAPTT